EQGNGVQKSRLLCVADRLSLMKARHRGHRSEVVEPVNRLAQIVDWCAKARGKIGPECDGNKHGRRRSSGKSVDGREPHGVTVASVTVRRRTPGGGAPGGVWFRAPIGHGLRTPTRNDRAADAEQEQ